MDSSSSRSDPFEPPEPSDPLDPQGVKQVKSRGPQLLPKSSTKAAAAGSPCGMVVPILFRRWVHVKHRNPQTPHGGFYCLLFIRGQRVIAAAARYRHGGQLEYKAYSMFVREYRDVLGLLSSTTLSFFTDVASISKDLNSEVDQHLPNSRVHTPSLFDIPNAEYR
ncbi:hypothetical protein RHSIM_RhsimUnG0143100 [Rhododendron simsii]|uniref:Uncharacterized protein n=1 Tax=Rhododendron simsii TaxID=118357 RepID=A0A834L448_RHOSS|nr:hypothetical protein RHSIM_RhsimUnG0143100 [Rhododendron simsii]